MLSKTAEYALRAVLYMARRADALPVSADDIADALDAPRNYLSKTLNTLAKARMLSSVRGPRGGFSLAVPADQLTVAQIVDAFDTPRASGMCLLGGTPCDPARPCTAHDRWVEMRRSSRTALETTTIAQMVGTGRGRKSLAHYG